MSTANLTSYKETHLNKPQEIQFSANPATISRASSRRLSHFCRRGKKETREAHIRTLVRERERGIKTSTSRLPEGHFDENSKIASSNLFEPFFKVATPFIGLKTRRKRRGNRVIHKLMPLDRSRSERKPFVALAAIMRTSGKTAKPFYRRLGQQLEKLYNSSVARRANAREVSPLQEKRDEVHRTAFDARPYR